MPNFALSHKAGPRRIIRNLSFYCRVNGLAARMPVGASISAQCYCARGRGPALAPPYTRAARVIQVEPPESGGQQKK